MKKKAKSNCLILTKHPGKCCKNSCISFYCPYFVCVPSSYPPPENIVTRMFTWTGSTWSWPCWRLLWWTLWLISSLQSHISPTRARYTFIYHNKNGKEFTWSVLRTFLKPTEVASSGCWNFEKISESMKSSSVMTWERRRIVTTAVQTGPQRARRISAMQRFIWTRRKWNIS